MKTKYIYGTKAFECRKELFNIRKLNLRYRKIMRTTKNRWLLNLCVMKIDELLLMCDNIETRYFGDINDSDS